MNKKLLTAAIAASLMAPGMASSDVVISGGIQAELASFDKTLVANDAAGKDSHKSTGSGSSSGNNYAISGEENLGGGLRAFFRIQNSFKTTSAGDPPVTAYGRYIGLKGAGWDVRYGRMNVAHKVAGAGYDPFRGTSLEARGDNGGLSRLNNSFGNEVFQFGFRTGGVSAIFQTTLTDDEFTTVKSDGTGEKGNTYRTDAGAWGAAAKYTDKRAGWEAGISYMDATYSPTPDMTPSNDVDVDANALKLHGKWSGYGVTLSFVHEDVEVSDSESSATLSTVGQGIASGHGPFDSGGEWVGRIALDETQAAGYSTFLVGVKYALSGNTELIGRYAVPEWTEYRGVEDSTIEGSQWAIGVNHKMSKRTHVYAGFMSAEYEHSDEITNSKDNPSLADPTVDTDDNAGESIDRWAVGVVHKF